MSSAAGQDPQLRAGIYARLSETYDAAESVPTQLANGERHAERRGWVVAGRFKDDGFSAYKEIARDDFVRLVAAIEDGDLDVVIVRDVDRLTRNLTDWNRFEKACVRHGVLLSPYTGGDLDLSTPEGAYYGGMETLRAKRESAVKSARVREAKERQAQAGKRSGGGALWFGYVRAYANPDEPMARKRVILREELHPVNAPALRDAAERILRGESVGSVIREWDARGIRPVAAAEWSRSSFTGTLTSPRIAGLLAWQGNKYPTSDWPAIIDVDTHERLVKLFSDPARRKHIVGRQDHLLSGLAPCPKCGHGLKYRKFSTYRNRADSYACVRGVGGRCGGVAIKAELLEEYVTGAVLDALESPRVQEALRAGDTDAPRRAELLAAITRAQDVRADARRDLADGIIDRTDWLDIRQRTEDQISTARRDYDRLTGAATVLGDIPPSDGVREAWESWNVHRRRAAIKAVLHKVIVKNLPPGTPNNPGGNMKDPAARREREMAALRQRVEFDWRI
ncbi:MAG: recombinase family protein [Trebonia sp.]